MLNDILPDGPDKRLRRNRLYALRALERLRVLGEEDLLATLADRPDLRWLVDEKGARWGILVELGRVREPERFEAAVGWVLRTRPRTEEARNRIRRYRAATSGLPGVDTDREGESSAPEPNGFERPLPYIGRSAWRPELTTIDRKPLARES